MVNKLNETRVSIVIPMLNEEKYIGKCLMSLVNQDWEGPPLDVIIVDGLSQDRSQVIVKGFMSNFSLLRIIENPRRITPISLNMGVKASTGEIIIILGAHSYVAQDFISKNLYYLNKSSFS